MLLKFTYCIVGRLQREVDEGYKGLLQLNTRCRRTRQQYVRVLRHLMSPRETLWYKAAGRPPESTPSSQLTLWWRTCSPTSMRSITAQCSSSVASSMRSGPCITRRRTRPNSQPGSFYAVKVSLCENTWRWSHALRYKSATTSGVRTRFPGRDTSSACPHCRSSLHACSHTETRLATSHRQIPPLQARCDI